MTKHYYPNPTSWEHFFTERGVRKDLVEQYLIYIKKLDALNLPVIFEFDHLSLLLGRTPKYLASVVNSPDSHYRTFTIPKRSGGHREISAPYPALLECQQWINEHILSKIQVSKSAHGFLPKKSIITNAKEHLSKKSLLKIDLKDFFPSIGINKVIQVFKNVGYPHTVSVYLAKICCFREVLPQGAATSPALSNIISFSLDSRINGLSKKYRLKYTRYADDLTFSGNHIPIKFKDILEGIINEMGFMVNDKKTKYYRSGSKRIVTGISVAGDVLKIPRGYKRNLRQEVHFIRKYGYFSQASKKKIYDQFYLNSIFGKLIFWRSVEPENQFVTEAITHILELKTKI